MVGLIVDGQDVLHAHQVGHHALEHLAFGFGCNDFVAGTALEQLPPALGNIDALAQLEGVIVGDDDLGAAHVIEHIGRHQFPFLVVAVGVVRLQHAQPVLDGQAWCADQEAARELFAARATHRVDGLPGNQHGHYGGLARSCGQFEGQPHQLRVGVLVGGCEVVEQAFAVLCAGCNLGQPDGRFSRFDLAEKGPNTAETVVPPVLEQPCRLRRNLPLVRIREGAPRVHVVAYLVDDRGRVVLLRFGR